MEPQKPENILESNKVHQICAENKRKKKQEKLCDIHRSFTHESNRIYS